MRTQIVINNTQIDLLKEVNLNITKQLVDIQNPEKRKTDRTLTIDIPSSKANDLLFSYLFEVNIDLDDTSTLQAPSFNPNKKAAVIIYVDSLTQLKGYCQVKDIVVTHRDKVTYKIVCYGEMGDLFSKIDNQEDSNGDILKGLLTDLDFSEFDHIYKRGNIASSWDTEIIENGVTTPFELGKGYIYPMVDYGIIRQQHTYGSIKGELWSSSEFRPAIYVKQYIDKIFETIGYTYTSNFINTDFFKRLFVPFNSDKFTIDKEEIDTRLFYTARDTSTITTQFTNGVDYFPIIFNNDSTAPYFDTPNDYNTSTGKFICSKAGTYDFQSEIEGSLKYKGSNSLLGGAVSLNLAIVAKTSKGYEHIGGDNTTVFFPDAPTIEITTNEISALTKFQMKSRSVKLEIGDEVFVTPYSFIGGYTLNQWEFITENSALSYFTNGIPDPTIQEGDSLQINQCIPTEIKQRDFLASIIKAFNLYIEPNPAKENDLIIEPRADYYTGEYTDWTEKLDLSKDFTISPMAALDAGEYHFKYKDDEDYLNKEYKNRYDRTYGDYKLKTENDFVKKTNKIELIFAPTPLYKNPTKNYDRVLPSIQYFDKSGKASPKTSKIRLLYYGGMKTCNSWFLNSYQFVPFQFDEYPYSGHLDDPYDSTFDLSFAPPFEIFYRSTANREISYNNQNLYTKYWDAQMKELTDKNSKLVEGWFYLTPSDIEGLSFRKYYFIKDAYYRLLKVENYNPVFSKVTKCKFLKVQEFDAPLLVKTGINGGRGRFGTTGTIYDIPTTTGTFAPIGSPTSGPTVVTGWDNTVDGTATSIFLTGIENTILSGSERIAVIAGGGNTIYPGLTDVTLINSSGIVATESNSLYINNQKYSTAQMGDSINITNSDSPYTLTNLTKTLFCDATEAVILVNLPSVINNNGKVLEIIKTDATANTITVAANGSETINGAGTEILSSAFETLKIVSNGTAWFKL